MVEAPYRSVEFLEGLVYPSQRNIERYEWHDDIVVV